MRALLSFLACAIFTLLFSAVIAAQEDSKCLECHSKQEFAQKTSSHGKSLQVDGKVFALSSHASNGCTSCHSDIDKLPHPAKLKPVSCAECHEDQQKAYSSSIHGKKHASGDKDAASCSDCHTYHAVKPAKDPSSSVYPLNLPQTCGKCHANTDMEARHEILVPDAFQEYVKSVHGKGLLKGGLLASASCNDCHGSHDILPNADPKSHLSKKNVPLTCGKCHVGVIEAYKKSIHGSEWLKGDSKAPTCTDCHITHEISKVEGSKFQLQTIMECGNCHDQFLKTYQQTEHGKLIAKGIMSSAKCSDCHGSHNILPPSSPSSTLSAKNIVATCRKCHSNANEDFVKFDPHVASRNKACLDCHADPKLKMNRKGEEVSLFVDQSRFNESVHSRSGCITCHTGIYEFPHKKRPEPIACGTCHNKADLEYKASIHAKSRAQGGTDAATCTDCHGVHYISPVKSPQSQVYPLNLPGTCGKCHGNQKLAQKHNIAVPEAYQKYVESVHGRGLLANGLLVSASCSDCHGIHAIKTNSDPSSLLSRNKIPETCGKCHIGVKNQYLKSIHGQLWEKNDSRVPICTTCHPTHQITTTATKKFQLEGIEECGNCHEKELKTYRHSYHGQVTALRYTTIAKCADCHGTHFVLPASVPQSTISPQNRASTCRKCHESASDGMASFRAHADPHDKEFPALYYTWLFMTILLVSVFSFFGLHTALWLIRGVIEKRKHPVSKNHISEEKDSNIRYQRFDPFHRVLHLIVITSFLGLAFSGLPLRFSYMKWAQVVTDFIGGFEVARFIHRVCILLTFVYFFSHLAVLIKAFIKKLKSMSVLKIIFGPDSPVPNLQDFRDFYAHVKWFVGLGPKPTFDRWTYWEKFDYWAVFWGVAVIGSSGLVLWFPSLSGHILPGWLVNIAMVVHSDEALLAMGFIFTVHFFNTHLRPEKFPMDSVIFTGSITAEDMDNERGKFKERMERIGAIESLKQAPPSPKFMLYTRIFAWTAVAIGIILLVLIILSAF